MLRLGDDGFGVLLGCMDFGGGIVAVLVLDLLALLLAVIVMGVMNDSLI